MKRPAQVVRRARISEIQDLLAIDHLVQSGDSQRASDRALGIDTHVHDGTCWVPVGSERINGYAVLLPHHFFGRDFLDLLVVAGPARRSGIASTLLRGILGLEGSDQVFTSTNRSNTPMQNLLEKEGWRLSGELSGLDEGDPELFFFTWRT